ncbi:hypothetical protein KDH83_17150 [Achromobacter sp. Marseille-Q0513]|uniref:hypothetical protein n=1 Tax=Achromobacter sp. Marseille-Q0513 TaxID=2829161 RepID=UPI001B9E98DC|nr:hypothetical protein [Achromobacter sp. Marseille-Q0513]MBR8655032.1 hypothetical protein [Achromobacter sp. Marseille-Q0513]
MVGRWIAVLGCAMLLGATPAWAWKLHLSPMDDVSGLVAGKVKNRIPYLDGASPLHEQMTLAVFSCVSVSDCKTGLEGEGIRIRDVLDGVRWNDFPTLWFTGNSREKCLGKVSPLDPRKASCYLNHLLLASADKGMANRGRKSSQSWAARGHFGDLQFLHGMGKPGAPAGETYENLLVWARFSYEVSLGTHALNEDVTRVAGMENFFFQGARQIGDLMDYRFDASARGIALGQLLHIVQDSYAFCHARRNAAGELEAFNTYSDQSGILHGRHDDDREALRNVLAQPHSPTTFGRELFLARKQRLPWSEVRPIFDAYIKPTQPWETAKPGKGCENRSDDGYGSG